MKDPALIRKNIRQQRASLTAETQKNAAIAASLLTYKQPWFKSAKTIAAYISVGGELDPMPLITQHTTPQQQILLPVLQATSTNTLWFMRWQEGDALRLNRYNIPEPQVEKHPLAIESIDIILMPLVAFDNKGNRIGMGGGYYDRTLAFTKRPDDSRRLLLIGYAYEFQKTKHITSNSWDVPLDFVVTEKQIYKF